MPKVEIKDGEQVFSLTPEEQAERDEQARNQAEFNALETAIENSPSATSQMLSELIGDNNQECVEPTPVMVGEQVIMFGIRKLSMREAQNIVRKRYRMAVSGKREIAPDGELLMRINTLVECVRTNTGTKEKPVWAPVWTFQQISGTATQKGLIDNPTYEAEELISQLLGWSWSVNASISPAFLSRQDNED